MLLSAKERTGGIYTLDVFMSSEGNKKQEEEG